MKYETNSDITILVIEDDRDLNELLCADLRDAGYRIHSALDGKTGMELANELLPDLVLLDVNLPDTTGIDISREMQESERLKRTPVIIITSRLDCNTRLASFISGARKYITKPFVLEDLLEEITHLMGRAV